MRFKRRMEFETGLKQVDIAPFINVVFLLLLFLLLGSSFVVPSGIKVDLPLSVIAEAVPALHAEIMISSQDLLYADGEMVTPHNLEVFLKQVAKKKLSVLIKADRRASLGKVASVLETARLSGVPRINIATQQE